MDDFSPAIPNPPSQRMVAAPKHFPWVVVAAACLALYFFLMSALFFYRLSRSIIPDLELYGMIYDLRISRFLLFSLLPFGFNAAFCALFGFSFSRHFSFYPSAERRAPKDVAIAAYGYLLTFFAWCILFNVPCLITGDLYRGWIPFLILSDNVSLPLRFELSLFFPMGDLGAIFGFSFGILLAGLEERRQMPATNRVKAQARS